MDYHRVEFTKKFLSKARKFQNPFIKFIVLWIGLNSLYHDEKIKQESEKIKNYFKDNKDLIFEFLCKNKQNLKSVLQFIENTPQHKGLREFLRTRRSFSMLNNKDNSIYNFAQFLYKVRNNMFHAVKIWDEEDEAKLLSMINPILEKLIDELARDHY